MPLSEYERRVLDQMERQLQSDDPKLASSLQGAPSGGVKRWLLVGLGVAVGIAVLVVGAATSQTVVGVLGFVIMFAAVVVGLAPRRHPRTPAGRGPAPTPSKGGFMKNLEDRWDRRRDVSGR